MIRGLFFLLFASIGFCALPPMAQSVRELRALLDDHRFYTSLGSAEQIKDIIRSEKGYLILTQNYAMLVDVNYVRDDQRLMGPAQFEFEFQEPIQIRQRVSSSSN